MRGTYRIVICKGFGISVDGNLSALMRKFDALMVCGWNGLHDMNPWAAKEDVKGEVKINYMALCFLNNRANFDG